MQPVLRFDAPHAGHAFLQELSEAAFSSIKESRPGSDLPACGTSFVAQAPAGQSAIPLASPTSSCAQPPSPPPGAVAAPPSPTSATPQPQLGRKSLWATLKDAAAKSAEASQRSHQVVYVSGPFDLKAKSDGVLVLDDTELVLKSLFLRRELFRVPYSSITGAAVDTAERMTLTRVVALGIFAFGFKKKEKFLKLDFKDTTNLDVTVVLGKASFHIEMDNLAGKILARRRTSIEQHGASSASAVVAGFPGSSSPPPLDYTRLLEELASLRDKGVISDDEFQKEKTELLTRI